MKRALTQAAAARLKPGMRFKPGTRVVVKRYPRAVRTVEAVYDPEIEGGRRLDRPVAGFVSWNVDDLRRA